MTDFTYEIKGTTLDMCEMQQVHENYEIFCTAEYLLENYDLTEEQALRYAAEVRRLMNKYGYNEDEAIDEVIK